MALFGVSLGGGAGAMAGLLASTLILSSHDGVNSRPALPTLLSALLPLLCVLLGYAAYRRRMGAEYRTTDASWALLRARREAHAAPLVLVRAEELLAEERRRRRRASSAHGQPKRRRRRARRRAAALAQAAAAADAAPRAPTARQDSSRWPSPPLDARIRAVPTRSSRRRSRLALARGGAPPPHTPTADVGAAADARNARRRRRGAVAAARSPRSSPSSRCARARCRCCGCSSSPSTVTPPSTAVAPAAGCQWRRTASVGARGVARRARRRRRWCCCL